MDNQAKILWWFRNKASKGEGGIQFRDGRNIKSDLTLLLPKRKGKTDLKSFR